jgi:hypothetical protein
MLMALSQCPSILSRLSKLKAEKQDGNNNGEQERPSLVCELHSKVSLRNFQYNMANIDLINQAITIGVAAVEAEKCGQLTASISKFTESCALFLRAISLETNKEKQLLLKAEASNCLKRAEEVIFFLFFSQRQHFIES